jgi:hypothetical protein
MSDHKVVYLIIERGSDHNKQTLWRVAGNAFVCRDGSLNLKLDMHPGLTFNIREPKSFGERVDAEAVPFASTNGHSKKDDDIPF